MTPACTIRIYVQRYGQHSQSNLRYSYVSHVRVDQQGQIFGVAVIHKRPMPEQFNFQRFTFFCVGVANAKRQQCCQLYFLCVLEEFFSHASLAITSRWARSSRARVILQSMPHLLFRSTQVYVKPRLRRCFIIHGNSLGL